MLTNRPSTINDHPFSEFYDRSFAIKCLKWSSIFQKIINDNLSFNLPKTIFNFMNDTSFSKKLSFNLPKMIVHFMNDRPFSKKLSSNLPKMIVHFMNDRPFQNNYRPIRSCHDQFSNLTWLQLFLEFSKWVASKFFHRTNTDIKS